jgi:hypothetical protein
MVMAMSGIQPQETLILGRWVEVDADAIGDENCQRIEYLTRHVLKGIGISEDGWDLLYQDKADGRYWELIYPQSHLRGGGPPSLIALDPEHARQKYRLK